MSEGGSLSAISSSLSGLLRFLAGAAQTDGLLLFL